MSRSHKYDLREVEVSPDGRYVRFEEKLGSGAYKEVYLCYDTETGKECAWNTVQLGRIPESEKRRIIMETEILASLHHPHIINFYHVWENPQLDQICLTGDHRVLTRSGWRSITRVLVGEELLSFNVHSHEVEWKPVTAVTSHAVDPSKAADTLYRMQGSGMDVIATRDHRMLVARPASGTGLQRRKKAVVYETVGELLRLPYAVNSLSTVPCFAHSHSRAVVCAGTIRQPPMKIVIPGLERVCEWWWRRDEQLGFLRFLGCWLADGFLDTANGSVCIGQRKKQACEWLEEQVLPKVFPRWWRLSTDSYDCYRRVYIIRCPPLYDYFRLMSVGPLGYNPCDPAELRAYPHFTAIPELAAEEQRSSCYTPDTRLDHGRAWSEEAMLAAARAGAEPDCCWWCDGGESEEDHELLVCGSESCQRGGHLQCAGLTLRPEGDWLCPECDRAPSEAAVQVEGVVMVALAEVQVGDNGDVPLVQEVVDEDGETVRIPRAEVVVDKNRDEAVERALRAAGKIAWWNNGQWKVIDGRWFYLKRWLGDQQHVANVYGRLSRLQAIALLDGFCRVNGSWDSIQYHDESGEPRGQWVCTNSSFPLIDNLMLIGQLAGAAIDVFLHSKAGIVTNCEGRAATLSTDHWLLRFSFTTAIDSPFQTAPLARPVDVSNDIDERGYYQYKDDGRVYCVSVADNANFLTQRLCNKLVETGSMAVRAQPVFVGNCFTTEIVTSGTLKEYTSRVKNIKLKVIKKWSVQTLPYARHTLAVT